jgi:endonuclease/exonuclease/phosphatase family metal-dependent hydrolase
MLLGKEQRRNLGSLPRLVDTYRALYPRKRRAGTLHFYFGLRGGRKIDYVISSTHFLVQQASIVHDRFDSRFPSDHFPVTAELGFVQKRVGAEAH